jgi:hypothetical protein
MPSRVQQLNFGLGLNKQTNISTASSTFIQVKKNNMDLTTPKFGTETDKDEIGKGNEFIQTVYPTAYTVANRIDKFASAEFLTWAAAYGLGNVVFASGTYTITPTNPATTLENPYFSVVEQVAEGGGSAIDNLLIGCSVEDFNLAFNYGPGRQSAKVTCNFAGTGLLTSPSGVTLGGAITEHYMLSQSMALTINGTDYVAAKTILSGNMGWKNNLLLNAGYFPGSGLQNGAAVRGRQEIGVRVPTLDFTARLLHNSTEYTKLVAQTTGTAVLTLTYDGTHTVTFTWQQMSFQMVENTEADGIVAVHVVGAPQYNSVNGILTVTAQCGLTGLAQ